MQHLRHPAPAVCRVGGQGAGGGVALRGPAAGPEPASPEPASPESAPEPPAPQNTALYWSFPGSALDVSLSRRWLAAAVEQAWGAGDDADRVVLAYSEVATNAVVHGRGPVTVSARIRDGAVTCEVADCSARTPQHRHAACDDVRGRGLDLVEMTVDRFRVDVGEVGKTVSFEVGRHTADAFRSRRSPLRGSGTGPVDTESEDEPELGSELETAHESAATSEPECAHETASGPGSASGTGRGPDSLPAQSGGTA